jgi:magnesium chelatase family protein
VARYQGRLSGPLLDRIDLHVEVGRVESAELDGASSAEESGTVAGRVLVARTRQLERQGKANARLDSAEIAVHCAADASAIDMLRRAMKQLALSARAYHRVLRVARTIADLSGREAVGAVHVAEAITLRSLDRRAARAGGEFISQ